jgi:hypothetical protein
LPDVRGAKEEEMAGYPGGGFAPAPNAADAEAMLDEKGSSNTTRHR